jgi:glutamate synthase (NADPH/NADH) large chain
MMMVPEAWDESTQMDPLKKAFYEFHCPVYRPWDVRPPSSSPTADWGHARLQRPATLRYLETTDGRVLVASKPACCASTSTVIAGAASSRCAVDTVMQPHHHR